MFYDSRSNPKTVVFQPVNPHNDYRIDLIRYLIHHLLVSLHFIGYIKATKALHNWPTLLHVTSHSSVNNDEKKRMKFLCWKINNFPHPYTRADIHTR